MCEIWKVYRYKVTLHIRMVDPLLIDTQSERLLKGLSSHKIKCSVVEHTRRQNTG